MDRSNTAADGKDTDSQNTQQPLRPSEPLFESPIISNPKPARGSLLLLLPAVLTILFLGVRFFAPGSPQASAGRLAAPVQAATSIITPGPTRSVNVVRTRPAPQPTRVPAGTPVVDENLVPAPEAIPAQEPAVPFNPADWMNLPVIPEISATTLDIYHRGLALGNQPNLFSKVGDCNTLSVYFLAYFDYESSAYDLGAYTGLAGVIDQFKGSFLHLGPAVGDGYNTSAVLSPFRADQALCRVGESPLECEYRRHTPSFSLIAIGTDDALTPEKFEANLREIVEITIERGIVPVLATKADDATRPDYNPIIAGLAYEYDIPLWNLAQAFLPVHRQGLQDDIHPSGEFAAYYFTEENLAAYGWPVRNLTALQMLDALWRGVNR